VFTSGADYTDIRVELTRQQLKDLACLPQQDSDGVDEACWYDAGDDNAASPSNLSDGYAFDGGTSDRQSRGRCIVAGDFEDEPPTNPLDKDDKSYLRAAGVELVNAELAGASSEKRQIANQADIFYCSGHGAHDSGNLYTDLSRTSVFSPLEAQWNKELKIVVISGCSVLDIKAYRKRSFHFTSSFKFWLRGGATSPGERWENLGPKYLVGYCWTAPNDSQGTAGIISTFLSQINSGVPVPQAWQAANDPSTNPASVNACVIDTSRVPHEFWYWDETSGVPVWTKVSKGAQW
jgi:hypothetical protein